MDRSLKPEERRRAPRIPLELPLEFEWRGATHAARTQDLSRRGALVLAPVTCPAGTVLDVVNLRGHSRGRYRVVWAWFGDSDAAASERYKLGLEAVDDESSFWGMSQQAEPVALRARA